MNKEIKTIKTLSTDPRSVRQRERIKQDPLFGYRRNLRTKMNYHLNRFVLENKVTDTPFGKILGLSSFGFYKYINKQLVEKGFTWENRSEWHLDHITPISTSDVTTKEQLNKLSHFTNIQVLGKIENIKKSNK